MAINSKKFEKLRKKLEKNLIGSYGSQKGLGIDVVVKKYSYGVNLYGDQELIFIEDTNVKGIVVRSTDSETSYGNSIKTRDGEIRLYIPISTDVEDTPDFHYEFFVNNNTYVLVYKNDIGQVCNMPSGGVVREITVKPKDNQ